MVRPIVSPSAPTVIAAESRRQLSSSSFMHFIQRARLALLPVSCLEVIVDFLDLESKDGLIDCVPPSCHVLKRLIFNLLRLFTKNHP